MDYNFFRDRWAFGTCSWILRDDTFTGWIDDTHHNPRILWAHGNASSGKSILSSFVIDHLIQLGLPCHYFFIRFSDQKKRGLSMILRSLARQLAYSLPAYADKLSQLGAAATDLRTADSRNIWQWLFKETLFQVDLDQPVYCVIDGVDEADSPGTLLRLLCDLHLTRVPLRFLIVSRKAHEISLGFQRLARQVHMESITVTGNQDDFRSYIDSEMDIAVEGSYRDDVTAKLLERAQGNFLWIHLAVQRINTCHTKLDVEKALQHLPAGMEALYDRMASSVQSQPNSNDRRLGLSILEWAVCARRVLSVEELSDGLDNNDLLGIRRTIGDLCGGFVVVDAEAKVSLIHETARQYLIREDGRDRPFTIDRRTANDKLLQRCIQILTISSLQTRITKNQPPALLRYAVNSWFIHLSYGSSTNPEALRIVRKFLQSPHVLTWIYIAAKHEEIRTLVVASRYLTDVVIKLRRLEDKALEHTQAIEVLERWATDLTKVVGKFGRSLTQNPDAIHKLIPPFCPESSAIYQQFGRKEMKALHVSDYASNTWDDCLARLSLDQGLVASAILPAGSRIAVLSAVKMTSYIRIYDAATFEERRRIRHPERVLSIATNKLGNLLVSYGYLTTRVCEMATGKCIEMVKNPAKRPRPHTLAFAEEDKTVLVGSEDRCVRSFPLGQKAAGWELRAQIEEEVVDDAIVNLPMCSRFSPDGTMIAFGYRAHPVTVWELEPLNLVGQFVFRLDETDMTVQEVTWGEVFDLAWHPFGGEVFGLTQVGLLFRWNPLEDEPSAQIQAGTDRLTLNQDGSLIATGDGLGAIKIFQSSDLVQLYQLFTQDPIVSLAFSTDSRRIYDSRGAYSNIWEPNVLARLAERSEYPDHNSDTWSETESLAKVSLHAEQHFAKIDRVIALSGQSVGPLYCYGTEDGVAVLCEVGKGKVCEVERLKSFMSIEQMTWSEDGKYMALSDLSGRLSIKRISRVTPDRGSWNVSQLEGVGLVIPPHAGHISQLFFNPSGDQIAAFTLETLYAVNITTRSQAQTELTQYGETEMKWMCHPTLSGYLLGFGATKLHILSWDSLREIDAYTYFPPRTLTLPGQNDEHRGSTKTNQAPVERLVSNADLSHVLLKINAPESSAQLGHEYLIFEVSDIRPNAGDGAPAEDSKVLRYAILPPQIASQVREPLAFLLRRRLMFLDIDRWICTWRLPLTSPTSGSLRRLAPSVRGRGSESTSGGIEKHYMLPGDWATGDEECLCSSMPDGTFLCPRNEDVATVQCTKLRK